MNNKTLSVVATIVGVIFIALAVYYFVTPANHIAHFLPGYDAAVTRAHIKHGIASLLLGLASFALAWFMSGKKESVPESKE